MDLNRRSVEELEQQIEKQKADLDRRLEAIRLVREMLAEAAPEAAVAPPVDAAQTEPPPQERAADDGPTLIESVEDLLKRENRAWTVPQVYDALRSKNFQFGSKTPKVPTSTRRGDGLLLLGLAPTTVSWRPGSRNFRKCSKEQTRTPLGQFADHPAAFRTL
jgi:hypothetical protein